MGRGVAREALVSTGAPWALAIVLITIWQCVCAGLQLPAYFLPAPLDVGAALAAHAGELLASAWSTLWMALAALVLAAAISLPMALLTGLSPIAERAIQPLAVTLQVTPVVAVAPLVMIWAGLDHADRAIIALAAIVAFFPLFSGALTGLKSADPDLERLFDLYGAGRVQRLLRLRVPAAAPFVLEGLKVAVGLAVIGAVVAEFVAGSGEAQGLAWRVLEAEHQLRTAEMFAALAVLAAMAAALHAIMGFAEKAILTAWRGRG